MLGMRTNNQVWVHIMYARITHHANINYSFCYKFLGVTCKLESSNQNRDYKIGGEYARHEVGFQDMLVYMVFNKWKVDTNTHPGLNATSSIT